MASILQELIPSMFNRRVLLLGGLLTCAAVPLAGQMVRLTLAQGEGLRVKAESKLQVERRLHNIRGSIVDRKGRPLAVDVPSYDIAVDYDVITGHWAFRQAAEEARKSLAGKWREMSAIERLNAAEERLPLHQARLEQAWTTFCQVAGISREDLEARKSAVVRQVSAAAAAINEAERQRKQASDEQMRRSKAVAIEVEVATADVQKRIAEQMQPHVLLKGVSDEVAFRFQALIERMSKVKGERAAGDGEFIPGLKVPDSAGRDYPLDSATITIDRKSFPGPLRSDQPITVNVQGVTTQIVGSMRKQYTDENLKARLQSLRTTSAALGAEIDKLDDGTRGAGAIAQAISAKDPGRYLPGDRAGRSGIEYSAEFELRGARGTETEQLDTGELLQVPPQRGKDVALTIDVMLQARIQALLDPAAGLAVEQVWHQNKAKIGIDIDPLLPAAVVVLDIDTSEILAMVSTPAVTREQAATQAEELMKDQVSAALTNKCINRAYPPGSIVKPLILCAAASAGIVPADVRIACEGHLYPENTKQYQCWIFKQFKMTHNSVLGHDLDGSDAIMRSCNIFFYTLGRGLGPQQLIEWYEKFGVGPDAERPQLGIGAQYRGQVGHERGVSATTTQEATLMGIGQGPIAWTPMHAADAFATIARSGQRIVPRLRKDAPTRAIDLHLDQKAVALAMDGLRRSVNEEGGTGYQIVWNDDAGRQKKETTFNATGVQVWGKSGTAAAPAIVETDTNEAGVVTTVKDENGKPVILRDGDHAWLLCMVGKAGEGRPRYVVAVVVEYGGSGGKVAGPIANQVIHALQAEGYL